MQSVPIFFPKTLVGGGGGGGGGSYIIRSSQERKRKESGRTVLWHHRERVEFTIFSEEALTHSSLASIHSFMSWFLEK